MEADIQICEEYSKLFNGHKRAGELGAQGKVGEDHLDWRSCVGQEVKGISLDSSTLFFSAAGTPKYTNYTIGFKDCLDYIFLEEGSASVEQVDATIPF